MRSRIRACLVFFLIMMLLTGGVYPSLVWFFGHVLFSHQANGSLLVHKGNVVGSELLAQSFTERGYFWPRLSATKPSPYNAQASGASNLGPVNLELLHRVEDMTGYTSYKRLEPADAVTSSASGLDPDISLTNALLQAPRIAKARGLPLEQIHIFIRANLTRPLFGFMGSERVNVTKLNFMLDNMGGGRK